MARGWESKSVEDQISAREADAAKTTQAMPSAEQRQLQSKRAGLLLMRTRTLAAIQSTSNDAYRKQQESALAHLDAELAKLYAAIAKTR